MVFKSLCQFMKAFMLRIKIFCGYTNALLSLLLEGVETLK